MTLSEMWSASPDQLHDKKVDQVIKFAGAGRLLDGNDCSQEFRDFLKQVPSPVLRRYADECLSQKFDDGGNALQDVVNEVGRRLGFEVINGRYRGVAQQIGHDGLWQSEDGYAIVVESKTTAAYQIRLGTISGYRKALINRAEVHEESSSILIIVGREDTTDLEAQIRGSRYAWDVRLISVDALVRLMSLKEDVDDPAIVDKIREILIPREYTKVDGIIDLVFSTAEDVRQSEGTDEIEAADDERPSRLTPVSFHDACIVRIEEHLRRRFLKRSRTTYSTADGRTVVVCAISKEHAAGNYWFAFHPHHKAALERADEPYVAFGCGSAEETLLMPANDFLPWLSGMNVTSREDRMYWHVSIFGDQGRYTLHRKMGEDRVDLSDYRLRQQAE